MSLGGRIDYRKEGSRPPAEGCGADTVGMAFDFKKGTGSDNKGFSAPFGTETSRQSGQGSGGFSFGGGLSNGEGPETKSTKHNSSGFSFGGQASGDVDQKNGLQNMDFSSKGLDIPSFKAPKRRSFKSAGGVDIPWKVILCVIAAVAVLALVIVYWDVILNFVYNVLAIMVLLVILLIVLRLLLRPRRRK